MSEIPSSAALWEQTSLSICSYLKEDVPVRRQIVRRAMKTWRPLLDLPFNERVFLDDHSPQRAACKILERAGLSSRFDRVVYHEQAHPPNCNFGTVYSLEAARGPFVVHIDDDVSVLRPAARLREFLESALAALAADERLQGVNILTVPATGDYSPAAAAAGLPGYTHPQRFFGTAASIVRRSLLERVSVADIEGYGEKQPAYWECLVSEGAECGAAEFLVAPQPTPFVIPGEAWLFSSTATVSTLGAMKFFVLKWLKRE